MTADKNEHATEPSRTGPSAQRHPGDIVRIVAASSLLGASGWVAAQGRLSQFETDVFRLVNDLPGALEGPLRAVMQAGSLVAVAVAAGAALAWRKPRLALDLGVAGVGAWFAAKGVKAIVGRDRPGGILDTVIHRGPVDTGLGFPSGHVAVATALAAVASPYLGRTARRVVWSAVAVVAVARIYVGAHLPADVVGGFAVGWLIAAVYHLAVGSPVGGSDPAVVRALLEPIVGEPFRLSLVSADARGSTPYEVTTDSGRRWFVKALSNIHRDNDLAFKVWRLLTRRRLEDEAPFFTPKQQVEHEAFLALLATAAGVRTPAFAATAADGREALVAFGWVDATPLDHLGADELSDDTLRDIWEQVVLLRSARLAHRDLRLANVMLDDGNEPLLVDFGFAEAAASDHRMAQDVAELLASSSLVVGIDRAVRVAVEVVGRDAVAAAVPLLQPMALSNATRTALRHGPVRLADLRDAAATASGAEQTQLEQIGRVRPRSVLLLLGLLFGIHLLLPQVGEFRRSIDALRSVEIGWVVLALIGSAATYVAAGVAQIGAVARPLPVVRTILVQLAASFTNRVTPANLGGAGINIRYLQRSGLTGPESVASVTLNTVAGAVVHLIALVVTALVVGGTRSTRLRLPSEGKLLTIVAAVFVVGGLVLWSPLGRNKVLPRLREGFASLLAVLRQPVRAAQLLGGSLGVTAFYALSLYTSLRAFGLGLRVSEVLVVYLGAAAIASVAPTPGGLGAMEAALVAGLTSFGAPAAEAIAGVLVFRLITFWLPMFPGWITFHALARREVV